MNVILKAIKVVGVAAIVASHTFLAFADFFGQVATADFLLRADGSRSVAAALTPLEATWVALVGLPHLVVVVLVIAGLVVPQIVSLRSAVFAALTIHLAWAAHIVVRAELWRGLFHPDSQFVTYEFFLGAHALWAAVSLAVLGALVADSSSAAKPSTKTKTK